MIFDLFKRKCVCGMNQEKGKGMEEEGRWFCCTECLKNHKKNKLKENKKSCCG